MIGSQSQKCGKYSKLQSTISKVQKSIVKKMKRVVDIAKQLSVKERLSATNTPTLGEIVPGKSLEQIDAELEVASASFMQLLDQKRALMPVRGEPIAWGFVSSPAYFADWRVNMERANSGDDELLKIAKVVYGSNDSICSRQLRSSFHDV